MRFSACDVVAKFGVSCQACMFELLFAEWEQARFCMNPANFEKYSSTYWNGSWFRGTATLLMYNCDTMRILPAVNDALGITHFHHQTCAVEIVFPPFLETAIAAAMFLGLARTPWTKNGLRNWIAETSETMYKATLSVNPAARKRLEPKNATHE